jgi:8-amino-7-oxononanoate synthase
MRSTVDFTSSLYLGMSHPAPWTAPGTSLTTGRPAALDPGRGRAEAKALAALVGCQRAVLSRSTLHAGWDLARVLGNQRAAFLVDEGAYPTSEVAVAVAGRRGALVRRFAHHDPAALAHALRAIGTHRPVVVVDGWCPGCGAVAPLGAFHVSVARARGLLLIDDTQALGVVGARPTAGAPWGRGGGGSLRHHRLSCAHVAVVCSLAKAFGVPVALTAGPSGLIDSIERRAPSRIHSSAPTAPELAALDSALAEHERSGEARRHYLQSLVQRFRSGLAQLGLPIGSEPFPVQTVGPFTPSEASSRFATLVRRGIAVVPQLMRCRGEHGLTFVLTASHTPAHIDAALAALAGT